jgi:hypothetical protein
MDIKFEHRIWRTFANLVSEVQGPGYNKYRTTKIRLLLTVARRLEWVGNLSHFDAMLSEKADMYISTGRWSGSKQDAMRYLFYTFISDRAADYAKHFTFGKRDRRTPWERELDRAKRSA